MTDIVAPPKVEPEFTTDWFDISKPRWENLVPWANPSRILEVGSYEGASACFLIEKLASKKPIELHCVDTWEGSIESQENDMASVESRFDANTALMIRQATEEVRLVKHKDRSDAVLTRLLAEGKAGYFDFVYIDGSHQAPDVLCDAVLGFRLCRPGGVLVFDDYLWRDRTLREHDVLRTPKMAIDAFTNIYARKIKILPAHLYQLYLTKLSD